jgi:hypothetical protein
MVMAGTISLDETVALLMPGPSTGDKSVAALRALDVVKVHEKTLPRRDRVAALRTQSSERSHNLGEVDLLLFRHRVPNSLMLDSLSLYIRPDSLTSFLSKQVPQLKRKDEV